MLKLILWASFLSWSFADGAAAEELEGYIRVGGRVKQKVFLISPAKAGTLCDSIHLDTLTTISGMTIRAQGTWKSVNSRGKKLREPCFAVDDYLITKTRTGKPTVVGVLKKSDKGFFIDSGTDRILFDEELPAKTKEMEGRRVIVALSKSRDGSLDETPTKVLWVAPVPGHELDQ